MELDLEALQRWAAEWDGKVETFQIAPRVVLALVAIATAAQKVRRDEERFRFSQYFSGSWAASLDESDELERDLMALSKALDSIHMDTSNG